MTELTFEMAEAQGKQDFVALDTTVVQVRSVLNFMYALGYTLDEESKTGRFITKISTAQGNRHLSFATAARLHNLRGDDWAVDNGSGETFPISIHKIGLQRGFTALGVSLAMASKLVQEVKLSVSRNGQITTQDVLVKPLNMAVLNLVEPTAVEPQ